MESEVDVTPPPTAFHATSGGLLKPAEILLTAASAPPRSVPEPPAPPPRDPMAWIEREKARLAELYPGEWIVVLDDEVIAHSAQLSEAVDAARRDREIRTPFAYYVDVPA